MLFGGEVIGTPTRSMRFVNEWCNGTRVVRIESQHVGSHDLTCLPRPNVLRP